MPDTIIELCEAIDKMESRSSVLTKTKPEFRRQIVEALINRRPATLHEVFDHFALDHQGISYTAFYYWARKVRRFAGLLEMTRTLEEKEDAPGLLPRVLASRVLDNVLDDQIHPNVLQRLMDTYRMACTIEHTKNQLDFQKRRYDDRRELDKAVGDNDILRLARLIARTKRNMAQVETDPRSTPDSPDKTPAADAARS